VSRHVFGLRGHFPKALAATLAVTLLAACETGPVYKPRAAGETVGYTDLQLSPNRYRVTFSANSATKREDVENSLLRRAAEVTLAAGYTHFVFDQRDTEARTYYRSDFIDPYFGGPLYGPRAWYWSSWPSYGYPYGAFGPYGYGPYGYGPGYNYVRPVTSYSAFAEIVMLTTEQTAGNPDALDAQFLIQRLVPPAAPETASAPQAPRS
jgi:hypothetical protein